MTNAPTPGMAEAFDAMDVADRLIERAYGDEVPAEWNETYKRVAEARSRQALAALAPVAAEGREKDKLRIAVEALEPFALLAPGEGKSPVNMSDPLSKWLTVAQLVDADEALSTLRTEPTGGGEGT